MLLYTKHCSGYLVCITEEIKRQVVGRSSSLILAGYLLVRKKIHVLRVFAFLKLLSL